MIKLWKPILQPVLEAASVKTIMEIGAEYGRSTNVLMRYVERHRGHLYCIDPVPAFDVGELLEQFPENLTFYQDLSLNVLAKHEPFDAVMVDGDHNWYTVYNELKLIEAVHGHDPLRQPIVFLHDIGWPYGLRDLYYDPTTIPKEFRQEHEKLGILPGKSELSIDGGMNRELWNASHEGGEKNGVLTGVEDYLKESKLDFEFINFPLYYGLGLLISKQKLAENEELSRIVEHLTSGEGMEALLRVAEHLRCVDGVYMQAIDHQRKDAISRIAVLERQLAAAGLEPDAY